MSPRAGGEWKRFSPRVNSLSQATKTAFTAAVSFKFIVAILQRSIKRLSTECGKIRSRGEEGSGVKREGSSGGDISSRL